MSKSITCPSGATAVIRKLNIRDIQSVGFIPDVLAEDADAPKKDDSGKNLTAASRLTSIALTSCLLSYVKDGKRLNVFDTGPLEEANRKTIEQSISMGNSTILQRVKDLSVLPDGILRLDEFLTDPDASFIVSEVMALSGFGAAAKEAARPFPEQQEQPVAGLQPVESVPSPAV